MTLTRSFILERETKGAVRYAEVNSEGKIIEELDHYVVGTLYIRKHVFASGSGLIPARLTITIDTEPSP